MPAPRLRLGKPAFPAEDAHGLLAEYNAGSQNIEVFFARLTAFAQELSDEEKRCIGEQLTEEELAIFDILARPDMKLSKKEDAETKKVARTLLETLKQEKLVLDWRKKQASRAAVRQWGFRTTIRVRN